MSEKDLQTCDWAAMYKLRTIDIWDTILRRKSSANFSKLVSARALCLTQHDQIKPEYRDHWAIYDARCSIEAEFTGNGDLEYAIDEVLQRTLEQVLKPEV